MKRLHITWRDASYTTDDTDHSELQLVTLEEVGYLIKEDRESITIGMEYIPEATSSRLTLTIPRVNIISITTLQKGKALDPSKFIHPSSSTI